MKCPKCNTIYHKDGFQECPTCKENLEAQTEAPDSEPIKRRSLSACSAGDYEVNDLGSVIPMKKINHYFAQMCEQTEKLKGCKDDKSFKIGFAMGLRCAERMGWTPPNEKDHRP